MDKILQLMGLALRARALVAGDEVVNDAVSGHKARLLLVAQDAAQGTVRKMHNLAGDRLPVMTVPASKEHLGGALGKSSCAVVAVLDMGFAAQIGALLAEQEPAYREMAEELGRKQAKRLRRKKEKPRNMKR